MIILHSLPKWYWETYKNQAYYGQDSLDQFGFIHCSEISTYQWVAPNFKEETDPYVLLLIDTEKLENPVIWEDLRNCGVSYPHIYGLLNTDAIIEVVPHLWSKDKVWVKNAELLKYEKDSNLKLILPDPKYFPSYREAAEEYKANGVTTYFIGRPESEVFSYYEKCRLGIDLPQGYVPVTYFWLVDDEKFIGEIMVRHALTPSLLRFGGHIGYSIRRSEWGKGYGTEMLRLALPFAKEITGADKVLITCNDDNIASARVMEHNGGILENKIHNIVDGKEIITRRYWITL